MRPDRSARFARPLVLLVLALLVAACGFQLRGYGNAATAWPETLARVHLTGEGLVPEVERQLGPALRRAGAVLVAAPDDSAARLAIEAFDESEDLLALGVGTTERDFQVVVRLDYTLTPAGAEARSGSVTASRGVQTSADAINASLAEARRVRRELREEVIDTLVRRLAAGG